MFLSNSFIRRAAAKSLPPLALLLAIAATPVTAAPLYGKAYPSPDAAAADLLEAARSGNSKRIQTVFGAKAKQLGSGDPVRAKYERDQFVSAYNEKHQLRMDGEQRATLVLGNNEWPFPIPVVKIGNIWRFDPAAGMDEIVNRRIGQNELYAIQVLQAIVDAQYEYASIDRDGDGLREYAQKFSSTPGQHDGLYWPTQAGEAPSPLGPLLAFAESRGYAKKSGKPAPYWGYYYRILTEQGSNTPGNAYNYLADGKLIGGFAVIAYPADYGASGIKSFIVNHEGVVYEKDLGVDTAKTAAAIKQFNPGDHWEKAVKPELTAR